MGTEYRNRKIAARLIFPIDVSEKSDYYSAP